MNKKIKNLEYSIEREILKKLYNKNKFEIYS